MKQIALTVPGPGGGYTLPDPGLKVGPGNGIEQATLGGVVSGFLGLVFYIALFLTFIWFVWGAYEYMVAQGQKEALQAARDRIRWSIIGFAVLVMAFLVGNYAMTIFPFLRGFYANSPIPMLAIPPGGP